MRQVCTFAFVDGIFLPSRGATDGIWVIWDTNKIEILQCWVRSFSVSMHGRLKNSEEDWLITGVYCPYVAELKPEFFFFFFSGIGKY